MNRFRFGLELTISLFVAVVGIFLATIGILSLASVIFYGAPGLAATLGGLASWMVSLAMLGSGLVLLSHGKRALVIQARNGPRCEAVGDADSLLQQLAKKLPKTEA